MPNRPKYSPYSPADGPEAELDYVQIVRGVLRRRKAVVVATFALFALPLLVWAVYGQRPRFQSTATVHIKPSIADMIPGMRELEVGPNLSVQMAVLQSRSLGSEVLEAVPQETLDELIQQNLEPDYFLAVSNGIRRVLGKSPKTISPRERALAELQTARMQFRPLKKTGREDPSGLVVISATAFKPRVAMDLVSAYVQVLLNWSRRSEQEDVSAAQKFLELQLTRVRNDMKESEAELSTFENQYGVVRLTDRTQFEMSRLVQLQGDLAQIQANEEVARTRLAALEQALNVAPRRALSGDQITAVAAGKISARLAQLEAALLQMQVKYTEEHPSVIATREEIRNLRSQLARVSVAKISDPLADIASMGRDELMQNIAVAKGELAKYRAEEAPLGLQIAQLRESLQKLSGRESEYSALRGSVVSNRGLLSFLLEKLFALRIREQSQGGVVKIIDPPNLPSLALDAVSLRKLVFLVAFALGTAVGLGFLIEYIYEPVESENTIRQHIGLPLLGSALAIPARRPKGDARPMLVFNQGRRAVMPQEFYRKIRTNLEAASLQSPFKAIMITSCWPGEGKSTTAINVAVTLRELGRRVALVEADLRHPSLNQVLRSETPGGLTKLLQEMQDGGSVSPPVGASIEIVERQSDPGFLFIPSGDPYDDPAALLGSARARELVARWKREWDYVLVDSPPILLVSDNVLFAKALDGAILVARSGQTKKRDLQKAKTLLEEAGVRIIGVILNEVPLKHMPYYYHKYRSYYAPYRPYIPRGPGKRK